jgi:MFS family permease
VPSGAWADAVDRRLLLIASGLIYAGAFACWMVFPSLAGFLVGFMLWGLSGAMQSGTFEAYLYDELAQVGRESDYAQVKGLAQAVAAIGELATMAVAAWLMAAGGYELVGWVSVALALVHAVAAASLPKARPVERADQFGHRYVSMLREGLHETARVPVVRRAVVVGAAMVGLVAFDEYLTLVGHEQGLSAEQVPWLAAILVVGYSVGTLMAGVTASWASVRVATLYGTGAVAVSAGVLAGGWAGYAALGVGYALLSNGYLVSEARLQEAIEGEARATVTSVWGLGSEVFAIIVFAAVGIGTQWWSLPMVVAACGVPLVLTALVATRWLPPPSTASPDGGPDVHILRRVV